MNTGKFKTDVFVVVCAWCRRILDGVITPNARLTHTICKDCFQKFFIETEEISRHKLQ